MQAFRLQFNIVASSDATRDSYIWYPPPPGDGGMWGRAPFRPMHAATRNVSRHAGHISKRRHCRERRGFSRNPRRYYPLRIPVRNFSAEFRRRCRGNGGRGALGVQFPWEPRAMLLPIISNRKWPPRGRFGSRAASNFLACPPPREKRFQGAYRDELRGGSSRRRSTTTRILGEPIPPSRAHRHDASFPSPESTRRGRLSSRRDFTRPRTARQAERISGVDDRRHSGRVSRNVLPSHHIARFGSARDVRVATN